MQQNNKSPLLSISCIAYNHAPYIRQCLDGFMMQKTDFAFEVLIHDDASTDGTADIIREYAAKYPDIIKPIFQTENQYSKGVAISATYNWPRAKGKYLAMCEGDDYWTDPLKLQKQVSFLEANPNFVICSHRYKILNEVEGTWDEDLAKDNFNDGIEGVVFDNAMNMKSWFTQTMTVVFRNHIIDYVELNKYKKPVDVHFYYHILKKGKGYCFNSFDAVYRRHAGGVFAGLTSYNKQREIFNTYKDIVEKNPNDIDLQNNFHETSNAYFNAIRFMIVKRTFSKKLLRDMINFSIFVFKRDGIGAFFYCYRKYLLSYIKSFSAN